MTTVDTSSLIALAEAVHRDGLDAHAASLLAVADRAADLGLNPLLSLVMLSPAEPYVARVRAFTRLSLQVAHRGAVSTRRTAAPVAA